MWPRASHQPRAPCPRTRTGLYQSDRLSPGVVPLSFCFLLPLREREGGPHLSLLWHRSWHPRHNLLREGGREGGGRRRSSSFGGKHEVRKEGRKAQGQRSPARHRGRQARPACQPQPQQPSLTSRLNKSTSTQTPSPPCSLSLPPSLCPSRPFSGGRRRP